MALFYDILYMLGRFQRLFSLAFWRLPPPRRDRRGFGSPFYWTADVLIYSKTAPKLPKWSSDFRGKKWEIP